MTRLLLATVAFAAFATLASAQEPGRQPPNPDTDHDGKVTLAEFKAMESGRQTRMFTRMDINKDGKITQAEMEAARKRMEAEGRGPPAAARPGGGGGGGGGGFLTRFDTNHDGAVSKAEMAAAGEQRFKTADTNHDGWLSKGELLMMRQRMRGPGSSE
jgi:Ca2+-binding EF-hand superfamily protein